MPTNSLWFQVTKAAEAPNIGWQVRVLAGWDYGYEYTRVLAYLDEYIELTINQELNEPGNATVTFDLDSPQFAIAVDAGPAGETLLAGNHLWEAWQDGVLRFQWFATNVTETVIDADGTRGVTVSGPGAASILTWAKVMPPGFPKMPEEQTWPWDYKSPAMQVYRDLITLATKRGLLRKVIPTFTQFKDSNGKPWLDVTYPYERQEKPAPELGSDLLFQLRQATGQETSATYSPILCDWIMWPGWKLDVRPTIGVDRSTKVIFWESQTQTVSRDRNREEISNIVVVRDDYGVYSLARDNHSIVYWGRKELLQQHGDVTDTPRRDAIAKNMLTQLAVEKSAYTIKLPPDLPGRVPFVDFNVGDWIGLSRIPWRGWSGEGTVSKYRVRAITMRTSTDGLDLELTLETLFEDQLRQLSRQIDVILNTQPKLPAVPATPEPTHTTAPTVVKENEKAYWNPQLTKWQSAPFSGGTGAGITVWISDTDPGTAAKTGDLWYDTSV